MKDTRPSNKARLTRRPDEIEDEDAAVKSASKLKRAKKRKAKVEAEDTAESETPTFDAGHSHSKSDALDDKVAKKKKKKLSPEALKKKASNMKQSLETEMKEIAEVADNYSDNTWLDTYKLMFRKLRKIMRKVEKRIIGSEKATDIYALMALYNQMREVIADMRSMIDLSQNTERITEQVLYPFTRDISNSYVDSIYRLMKVLRLHVDGEKYAEIKSEFDRVMREHGKYIQSSFDKSCQRLSALLEE